jgi:hypothetical protein
MTCSLLRRYLILDLPERTTSHKWLFYFLYFKDGLNYFPHNEFIFGRGKIKTNFHIRHSHSCHSSINIHTDISIYSIRKVLNAERITFLRLLDNVEVLKNNNCITKLLRDTFSAIVRTISKSFSPFVLTKHLDLIVDSLIIIIITI